MRILKGVTSIWVACPPWQILPFYRSELCRNSTPLDFTQDLSLQQRRVAMQKDISSMIELHHSSSLLSGDSFWNNNSYKEEQCSGTNYNFVYWVIINRQEVFCVSLQGVVVLEHHLCSFFTSSYLPSLLEVQRTSLLLAVNADDVR